uniref:Uncharacterized protein n=1 Tax=Oryza nivara TaxID=4536 RepID=A0A0E0GP82_ORYNI
MIIATLSSPPSTRDYSACAISAAHPASAAFNPSPQRQILKSDALSQSSSLPPPLRLGPPRLLAPPCRRSSAIALQSVPQWSRAQLATPPRRATVVKPSADTEPPSLSLLCESSSVATVGRG